MKRMHVFSGYGFEVILVFLALTIAQSAMAGFTINAPSLHAGKNAAEIAFQYVGRNVVTNITGPGAGEAFTVGYYTYISGIPEPLFSDPSTMGEATAYFTFRSEPYNFSTFANENTLVRTVSPGFLVNLYYDEVPDQTFDDPNTFSDGRLIATFKVLNSLATRVEDAANELGSLELISSNRFLFQGRPYRIRNIIHKGATLISSGSAVPVDPDHPVFAYSGSALAY